MTHKKHYDAVVIGAGIVGCCSARELSRYKLDFCVVDKALDVADASSRSNSGIVHAGFDAKAGYKKAHYNVRGSKLYPQCARDLDFPFQNNTSLVLAFTQDEQNNLHELYENGVANGVEGLQLLTPAEVKEKEPNLSDKVLEALYAPTGGITNPYMASLAFAENAVENGAEFALGNKVVAIRHNERANNYEIELEDSKTSAHKTITTRAILNAAGVFSDRIGQMVGLDLPSITARKGEYLILDKYAGDVVKATIFRAPSAVGKGVLVSPTSDGNIIVGPNAHAVDRDKPGRNVETTKEGIDEIVEKARDLWPELNPHHAITRFAGLRATAENGDFTLGMAEGMDGFFNAVGIESPGLTSAPAIAQDLAQWIAKYLGANKKSAFNPYRKNPPAFVSMTDAERAEAVQKDSAWGRMVCRCEKVTEAQVVAAIHSPIPATTIDAIKWRTRAGMGRCHGGFCSPRVAKLIAQATSCKINEVCKRDPGSTIAPEKSDILSGPLDPLGAKTTGGVHDPNLKLTLTSKLDNVDICIIGGGAAGIAAALAAKKQGIDPKRIVLIDRENALGGILKQCIHPGFGLERYREELTGPEYAYRDINDLAQSGIYVMENTTVTNIENRGKNNEYVVDALGAAGREHIKAKSVIMATGARERSAGQIDLNGDRPAGVYTAGCAQHLINLMGVLPGKNVVIYGSGDIGLIMARRLVWEGAHVAACVVRRDKPRGLPRNVKQCLIDNNIPIMLYTAVVRVIGKNRVEAVVLCDTDKETFQPIPGTERTIACDTLLLSCGLIPEQDLLTQSGATAEEQNKIATTWPGVYLCGNAAQIHDIVDNVTREGEMVGSLAAKYVLGTQTQHDLDALAVGDQESAYLSSMPSCTQSSTPSSQTKMGKTSATLSKQERTEETSRIEGSNTKGSKNETGTFEKLDSQNALIDENNIEGAEQITCICCPKGCTIYATQTKDINRNCLSSETAYKAECTHNTEKASNTKGAAIGTNPNEAKNAKETHNTKYTNNMKNTPLELNPDERNAPDNFVITGYACKKGREYALEELTAPKRTLSCLVRCKNRLEPLSVRTNKAILKSKIGECLSYLKGLELDGSYQVGDILVENICNTGAQVIATKNLN